MDYIDFSAHHESFLAICSKKILFLPTVSFLTDNFESILGYSHLSC